MHATDLFGRLGLSIDSPNAGVYDGSKWKASGSVITSYNPSTAGALGQVQQASSSDVVLVLARAKAAQVMWRKLPTPRRGQVLLRIRQAIVDHIQDLGALVCLEMGKISSEATGEVQEFVDVADYAVGLSRSIGGTVVPSEREGHFITEVSNPLGVVGVISAFNFPIAVSDSCL